MDWDENGADPEASADEVESLHEGEITTQYEQVRPIKWVNYAYTTNILSNKVSLIGRELVEQGSATPRNAWLNSNLPIYYQSSDAPSDSTVPVPALALLATHEQSQILVRFTVQNYQHSSPKISRM